VSARRLTDRQNGVCATRLAGPAQIASRCPAARAAHDRRGRGGAQALAARDRPHTAGYV